MRRRSRVGSAQVTFRPPRNLENQQRLQQLCYKLQGSAEDEACPEASRPDPGRVLLTTGPRRVTPTLRPQPAAHSSDRAATLGAEEASRVHARRALRRMGT